MDTEVTAAVLVQSDSIQQPRLSNVWRHGSQRQWKQTTGVQRCQCQKQRAQLNHITASLLAWARLHQAALLVKTTVYALKQALLDAYLCKQLRYLAFAITSA